MAVTRVARRSVSAARLLLGVLAIRILAYAYVLGVPAQGANPFNYFGFFTNLTNLLAGLTLVVCGVLGLQQHPPPGPLQFARGVAVSCMLVVAVIYNTLIPGTGSAPAWVSLVLHALLPAAVLLDWALVGDRQPLPWRSLWVVLPYPLTWLAVVLLRGVTDGWVPYGFLLPSHGFAYVLGHVLLLLVSLLIAAALVWLLSRLPGAPALTRHGRPRVS
ncbi:Pr6Pr family membrane protein [Leucobacter albus]|uniref:Pr6Pr family membrane protein n=1 Tax=Leucobacter albus TaxID=272210 RepID=A0ABW3TJI8_9MICO